ncbi:putative periplasmic lipoprotein [Providencia heimbachae]|uniref:hypothetical protein n=1 Tax=Providencia heimbachae TaxID=333962 RepID=UPI0010BF0AAA|nr:hypothetical protein [Providencia heimbachae]MDD9339997.1 hypothetical protein [Providencia heimbachae]QCJ70620.1 hypothetical protein C9446_12620 [Providencia heimbachae]
MKKIMITALLALFLSGCDNSPPAPYGFKWGQSVEEIQKLNLEGANECKDPACSIMETPSGAHGLTTLIFYKESGLAQILHSELMDKTNKADVIAKFNHIGNELKSIYGNPVSETMRIDDEGDFFTCLERISCRDITAEYNKDDYQVFVTVGFNEKNGKPVIFTNYQRPLN